MIRAGEGRLMTFHKVRSSQALKASKNKKQPKLKAMRIQIAGSIKPEVPSRFQVSFCNSGHIIQVIKNKMKPGIIDLNFVRYKLAKVFIVDHFLR